MFNNMKSILGLVLFLVLVVPARAAEVGAVNADVVRVIDGDTVEVRAAIWLGQSLVTRVRLAGIDAPDRDCPEARARARERARDLLGATTTVSAIHWGKYAGRVMGRLSTWDGRDLSDVLVAEGLAKPYGGRGPRPGHC